MPGDAAPVSVPAVVASTVIGLVVLSVFAAAGLLLYQRLYGDSATALAMIAVTFLGVGAYTGWLVGVLAYSSLRPPADGAAPGSG